MFWFGYSSQKHYNMRMTDSFHRIAFAEEISQAHISIFDLELFNNDIDLSPLTFINDSISSFINFFYYLNIFPFDF